VPWCSVSGAGSRSSAAVQPLRAKCECVRGGEGRDAGQAGLDWIDWYQYAMHGCGQRCGRSCLVVSERTGLFLRKSWC